MVAHGGSIGTNFDSTNMLGALPKFHKAHSFCRANLDVHNRLRLIHHDMVSFQILPGHFNEINRRKSSVLIRLNLELAPLRPLYLSRSMRATRGAQS